MTLLDKLLLKKKNWEYAIIHIAGRQMALGVEPDTDMTLLPDGHLSVLDKSAPNPLFNPRNPDENQPIYAELYIEIDTSAITAIDYIVKFVPVSKVKGIANKIIT